MKKFSIIGAGNLGANLVNSLCQKGYHLQYVFRKSRFAQFHPFLCWEPRSLVEESDFIFIATGESQIKEVAQMLARETAPKGKVFFHTANSLTSDQLLPLREKGGLTASFSPLQTFVDYDPDVDLFKGIYFLAEGDDRALGLADKIAADLGAGGVVRVDKTGKIYYHMAAVASANFLVALLGFAREQLHKSDEKQDIDIMLPLLQQTLDNIKKRGIDASLSGPVKRKEYGIVQAHLSRLEGDEADLYRALSNYLKHFNRS